MACVSKAHRWGDGAAFLTMCLDLAHHACDNMRWSCCPSPCVISQALLRCSPDLIPWFLWTWEVTVTHVLVPSQPQKLFSHCSKGSTGCRSDAIPTPVWNKCPWVWRIAGRSLGSASQQCCVPVSHSKHPLAQLSHLHLAPFWLQVKCWILHMVTRKKRAFSRWAVKQEDTDEWQKYQKGTSCSFSSTPFPLCFLKGVMLLPKGSRPQDHEVSLLSRVLLGVAAGCEELAALAMFSDCFGLK